MNLIVTYQLFLTGLLLKNKIGSERHDNFNYQLLLKIG
jgi:hypothetical protein